MKAGGGGNRTHVFVELQTNDYMLSLFLVSLKSPNRQETLKPVLCRSYLNYREHVTQASPLLVRPTKPAGIE